MKRAEREREKGRNVIHQVSRYWVIQRSTVFMLIVLFDAVASLLSS